MGSIQAYRTYCVVLVKTQCAEDTTSDLTVADVARNLLRTFTWVTQAAASLSGVMDHDM